MHATGYDAELRLLNDVLRRAAAIAPTEHVLDIGCGAGLTTREAARAAARGTALGVDVSAPALERARAAARDEGLTNVRFEEGDAQTHPFPALHYDVAISRFGTMFFADPVAAFVNIASAMRASGRLVMLVWQSHDRNEWDAAIRRSLAPGTPSAAANGPDPFTLADPQAVTGLLHTAGFDEVTFTDVREPICFGPDVPSAMAWIRGFSCTGELLGRLGPPAAEVALDRLRREVTAHRREDGVWFGARSWLVSARRP
ncbi:class I SAM-dependent methyltransferase [Actinoplanes sp. CA-030573]|uniref:class I SAM-dependent methyltransferase n=1 Tax=Actinoplanes sp. CA-030573 TaxID=3239898 RepID=UPI003D8ECD94